MTTNEVITQAVLVLQAVTGTTNIALGAALGIAPQQVVMRKNGSTRWSMDNLDAMSAFFGIPPKAFLEGQMVVQALLTTRRDLVGVSRG